jgi:hypothetical protein
MNKSHRFRHFKVELLSETFFTDNEIKGLLTNKSIIAIHTLDAIDKSNKAKKKITIYKNEDMNYYILSYPHQVTQKIIIRDLGSWRVKVTPIVLNRYHHIEKCCSELSFEITSKNNKSVKREEPDNHLDVDIKSEQKGDELGKATRSQDASFAEMKELLVEYGKKIEALTNKQIGNEIANIKDGDHISENSQISQSLIEKQERMENEIAALKKKHEIMEEEHKIMNAKHNFTFEALMYLNNCKLNMQKIFSMSQGDIEKIISEVQFVKTCELPSTATDDLNTIMKNENFTWLQNELHHEELMPHAIHCKEEYILPNTPFTNVTASNRVVSRYAPEIVVDLNSQLELLKHQSTDENAKRAYSVENRLFTVKVGDPERKVHLKVLANLHADKVANICINYIKKFQKLLISRNDDEESTWVYCPIVENLKFKNEARTVSFNQDLGINIPFTNQTPDNSQNHFYACLFNVRRTYGSNKKHQTCDSFELRYCIIDSLLREGKPACIEELERLFLSQENVVTKITMIQNIKFGKNTKQLNAYDCSHYITSNLEYLLRAPEEVWNLIDEGVDPVTWTGISVPGGYYASKLARLVVLFEIMKTGRHKRSPNKIYLNYSSRKNVPVLGKRSNENKFPKDSAAHANPIKVEEINECYINEDFSTKKYRRQL